MLNKLWPIMIIISIIYAILSGNIDKLNKGIFESIDSAVELGITFLGTMCFWNGIMNIAFKSKLIEKMNKVLNPIINKLFPDMKKNNKIKKEISMNMLANILGLGNAATPLGIKAIKSMQEENEEKDTLSNSMMMLIVINTASIQLIPTTIIAIRTSLNSSEPTSIIIPVWCATVSAIIAAVTATKFLIKKEKKNGKN